MRPAGLRPPAALRPAMRRLRRLVIGPRPIILMYHRVARLDVDPWDLAVSPERFERQIALLCRSRRVVPLGALAEELSRGRLPHRTAAVTFDDGYADVFENALPVLSRHACPATVFVTTKAIGGGGFWWDVLARIVLRNAPPAGGFRLEVGGRALSFLPEGPEHEARAGLLARLHAALKPMGERDRTEALSQIAAAFGTDADHRPGDRAMRRDELEALAGTPGIEIGAHTVSHPSMSTEAGVALDEEVRTSRSLCEAWTGRSVTGFAYPYGDYDAPSLHAVHAAGLTHACTTNSGAVTRRSPLLELPRILVADWDEATFRAKVLSHG